MKHADKTINYRIYAKIDEKIKPLGNTKTAQLPAFEFGTETMSGPGIIGEIEIPDPFAIGSMTFSPSVSLMQKDHIKLMAPGIHDFEVRWAVNVLDSSGKTKLQGHKMVIRGMVKKFDQGKVENASPMDGSGEWEVIYCRYFIDGEEQYEVDKLNGKLVIAGVNYGDQLNNLL